MRWPGPTLEVGTLRLHLPLGGHAERGATVARLVGERLAATLPGAVGPGRSHDRLELRGLRVPAGASDHELAAAISAAIVNELTGASRGGRHG
jgi:hypothetical protein